MKYMKCISCKHALARQNFVKNISENETYFCITGFRKSRFCKTRFCRKDSAK